MPAITNTTGRLLAAFVPLNVTCAKGLYDILTDTGLVVSKFKRNLLTALRVLPPAVAFFVLIYKNTETLLGWLFKQMLAR